MRYEIEIKNIPSIHDNIKNWKVFYDEEQIKDFLELIGEFSSLEIDQEEEVEEGHTNRTIFERFSWESQDSSTQR